MHPHQCTVVRYGKIVVDRQRVIEAGIPTVFVESQDCWAPEDGWDAIFVGKFGLGRNQVTQRQAVDAARTSRYKCPDCKDTGEILLLTSKKPCRCREV